MVTRSEFPRSADDTLAQMLLADLGPETGEPETGVPETPGIEPRVPESQRWRDGALLRLIATVRERYGERRLGTGEAVIDHALSMAQGAALLGLDLYSRLAGLLFALAEIDAVEPAVLARWLDEPETSGTVAQVLPLVQGLARLKTLRPLIAAEAGRSLNVASAASAHSAHSAPSANSQAEILRKMLLAMASDIRVVLLRLISRTQSLRYFAARGPDAAATDSDERAAMGRETLAIYAPLANRLGIWQLKWEMEDLAFRFIEPETYKRIARLLDEKRGEREAFMERTLARLRTELGRYPELAQVQVAGRPKHIYSIWNKMRQKGLAFEQLYDIRAVRIIVGDVRACYTALGVVHQLWQPIRGEFDDYIAHPKGNDYRSLHTAVIAEEGRSLEVQIRTGDMHHHAELGVAAHWRYKEAGHSAKAEGDYENKIAWLRQLLSWREDIADAVARTALDDTLYVMSPQGRVIDLPRGATPLDFAYRVHTDLGHRCRGARVDGQMVPLATPLVTGQRVEIITAKSGGPSRDWLTPGYLASHRARQKVRQWFAGLDAGEQLAQGRVLLQRELQRLGETHTSLDALAARLGLNSVDAVSLAVARGDIGSRAIALALRGEVRGESRGEVAQLPEAPLTTVQARADARSGKILVVGVDNLLTQMGRCCKPIPPDAIIGFVTRGKGVSVHRLGCRSFENMAARNPERVISAQWGGTAQSGQSLYAVDLRIAAGDRHDLLRDVSEVLTRERVAVTAMKSRVRQGTMHMALTLELNGAGAVQRIIGLLRDVRGVIDVRRA